jgi:hypothetical protein
MSKWQAKVAHGESRSQSWRAKVMPSSAEYSSTSDETGNGLESYSRDVLLAMHSLMESRQLLKRENLIGLRTQTTQLKFSFNPSALEFVPSEAVAAENVLLAVPAPQSACDYVEVLPWKPSEAPLKECDSFPGSARTSAGDNEANSSSPDDEEDEVSDTSPGKATGFLLDWGASAHSCWRVSEPQSPSATEGRPPPR